MKGSKNKGLVRMRTGTPRPAAGFTGGAPRPGMAPAGAMPLPKKKILKRQRPVAVIE